VKLFREVERTQIASASHANIMSIIATQSNLESSPQPALQAAPIPWKERWSLRLKFIKLAVFEYLLFDSTLFKFVAGWTGLLVGFLLYLSGKRAKGFAILAKVHSSAYSEWASRRIEALLRRACQNHRQGLDHPLLHVFAAVVTNNAPLPVTARFFTSPEKILKWDAFVLKSPGPNEKGVILLRYLFVYPLFAKFFDLDAITQKYYIALEPTWSGYCDLQILPYTQLAHPVFVGSIEPRETQFIENLQSNLVPVHFSNNTWLDHRQFMPLPGVEKDIDIIMVASWAKYKRHWAFFAALKKLRDRGKKPKVVLIGGPLELTLDDIRRQAEWYGVSDLVELHEYLSPAEVNRFFNRAKVHVLWSRREGWNRAIIEGMLAGVPCIVRQGHNYGHHYAHINSQTGRFSTEKSLPNELADMIEHYDRYSPREWVMANMTAQRSALLLSEAVKAKALEAGEVWTRDVVAKTDRMAGQSYWDDADDKRFEGDYDYLRSMLLRRL